MLVLESTPHMQVSSYALFFIAILYCKIFVNFYAFPIILWNILYKIELRDGEMMKRKFTKQETSWMYYD